MILENKNDELIIRVSSREANLAEIERLPKFIRYKELVLATQVVQTKMQT